MKRITLILALIGMISLSSCTVEETYVVDDTVDNDTISEVWEYENVDFYTGNNFSVYLDFPHAIYTSDMVLVYRLADFSSAGDVWKLLPETYYFNDGTVDFGYENDATTVDTKINMFGYDLAGLSGDFTLNQIFRVVVVPGYYGRKMSNAIDYSDYKAVIKEFKINENNITKIKL